MSATVFFLNGSPSSPSAAADIGLGRLKLPSDVLPLPGYGGVAELEEWSTTAVAEDLERRLAGRGPVVLVGFSGGGYHALHLAARGRVEVRGLVALAGFADLAPGEGDGLIQLAALLHDDPEAADQAMVAGLLSPTGLGDPVKRAEAATWIQATSRENLRREFLGFAQGVPDLRDRLALLDIPIVARVGALDVATPPIRSERLVARLRHGALEIVPGVGHALSIEDAAGTTASIERLLDRI